MLAEAIVTASNRIDVTSLIHYAQDLEWTAALRRIGSIADTLEIENGLVFKGGTALRLCHIDEYRYSADLDFSLISGSIKNGYGEIPHFGEVERHVTRHLRRSGLL